MLRGELRPARDLELEPHEVEARDRLGHRVLDLEPRVHLEEEELARGREQELDGTGVLVADRLARGDGGLADRLAERRADGRARRLLDDLLVAALDRALALVEVDDAPVRSRRRSAPRRGGRLRGSARGTPCASPKAESASRPAAAIASGSAVASRTTRMPRPPPPADAFTSSGRPSSSARVANTSGGASASTARLGSCGTPAACHPALRLELRAHRRDRLGRRPDEQEPRVAAGPGEGRVLREEAVARVHGVRAGAPRGAGDRVDAQVRLGGRRAAERHREVRLAHEGRAAVGLREDGDGLDAHRAARALDAPRDLASVRDQEPSHRRLTSGTRRTRGRRRSRSRVPPRARARGRSGCRAGRGCRRRMSRPLVKAARDSRSICPSISRRRFSSASSSKGLPAAAAAARGHDRERPGELLGAHDRGLRVRPEEEEARAVGAAAHAVVPGAVGAAHLERQVRHRAVRDRVHHQRAVLDDAALLVTLADHVARHVLDEDEGRVDLVRELDELRRLLRLLGEEHALVVREDPDVVAVDAGPAGDEVRAVEGLELVEARSRRRRARSPRGPGTAPSGRRRRRRGARPGRRAGSQAARLGPGPSLRQWRRATIRRPSRSASRSSRAM